MKIALVILHADPTRGGAIPATAQVQLREMETVEWLARRVGFAGKPEAVARP